MTAFREKLHFQKRTTVDDGFGNQVPGGPWVTQFTEPARLRPGLGSETVIASRLQGVQPYRVTIRSSQRARAMTTAWRAIDARSDRKFAIKAIANPDEHNRYLELMVVEGDTE